MSDGFAALRRIVRSIRGEYSSDDILSDVGDVISDLDELGGYAWQRVQGRTLGKGVLAINTRMEQIPDPDCRVKLEADRDPLGLQRISLDWKIHREELASIRWMHERLGEALGRAGLGRVRVDIDEASGDIPPGIQGGYHHMGTTRMSSDPKTGVVDSNCRVHGLENLYVAGSSIFPTGGRNAPTLSIVAFALRLEDHLGEVSQS